MRPEKPIAVEMNQVIWCRRDPNFRFPGDICRVLSEHLGIGKRRDVYDSHLAIGKSLFKFMMTFGRNRAVAGNSLDEEEPVPLLVMHYYVGKFVM